MTKKVAFGRPVARPEGARPEGARPEGARPKGARAEAWVRDAAPQVPVAVEATRRLTIDIPVGLHTRLKVGCALKGRAIAEEVRDLLERAFPKA